VCIYIYIYIYLTPTCCTMFVFVNYWSDIFRPHFFDM